MVAHRAAPHGPTFTRAPPAPAKVPSDRPTPSRAKQRKDRHGSRSTKPVELHEGVFCQPGAHEQAQILTLPGVARPKKARDFRPGLAPQHQSNQRPNQLKRQTSSVEMNSVAFCELSATPVTGMPPPATVPLSARSRRCRVLRIAKFGLEEQARDRQPVERVFKSAAEEPAVIGLRRQA